MTTSLTDPHEYIRALYTRRARFYDFTANLYYLAGFREWAYRRRVVELLQLKPGMRVLEIGCGTGINFELVREKIGTKGEIVGIDLTEAMLEMAKHRIEKNDWSNVRLFLGDAAAGPFPGKFDAIYTTFALGLCTDIDAIIAKAARALRPGGRFVVLDLQPPRIAPRLLTALSLPTVRPFGLDRALLASKPWEKIYEPFLQHFPGAHYEDRFIGVAFFLSGEK